VNSPPDVFAEFARRSIETDDGVAINCVSAGDGPPVLLLHGFPQCLAMWAHVAPSLVEAGYTVVCADLRGYGDSSKPHCLPDNANYSFRAMAGDAAAVMEALGFTTFHVVGHDRGGRVGHRLALDRPDAVRSLAVLDIVPTHAMFMDTNRHVAGAYWHWYFLSQPEPFPERLIGNDPDFFYETCLVGWGATGVEAFDPELFAEYRRCWRDPAMIHGSTSDYRAAATIDLEHDEADIDRGVGCPTLVMFGADGVMARHFDIPAEWRRRCSDTHPVALPGGHFFVDQYPRQTADALVAFLADRS
jgi:haloacetate dehalogenase